MRKTGKKFAAARQQVPDRAHSIEDAVPLMQKVKFAKFDETVEIAMNLNLDPRKPDQNLRGAVASLGFGGNPINPESAHAMREPEMPRCQVVRGHPHALFYAGIELVEQVRVHSHPYRDGKVPRAEFAIEAPHRHLANRNAAQFTSQRRANCTGRIRGYAQIVSQRVGGPHRKDCQCGLGSG